MSKRFQEILNLAQTGSQALALKKCKRILKKSPRDINILLLTASIYAQDNDMKNVIKYCSTVLQIDSNSHSALYNVGVAYLSCNDYTSAKTALEKLIHIDPNHASGHTNLCLSYWNLNEYEAARKSGLLAIQFTPKSAISHNNLGLAQMDLEEIDSAIQSFETAITLDPSLVSAHYNIGIIKLNADDESGISNIDNALKINPDYPEANHRKALELLKSDKARESLFYFDKAIKNKPDFSEAHCNYGNALTQEQQFSAAETEYRKALAINPDYASAYNNLGNALLDQEDYKKNFEEAEDCYLKAIELVPTLYDAYKNLAVCYQGEGLTTKALHYFEIYNEHVPDNQVVIAGMASVHERQGSYNEGMALIEPYLNDTPLPEVLLSYGKLSVHFDKVSEAISALKTIDDSKINTKIQTEKYFLLGKLSEKNKTPDDTFYFYKKANDLDKEIHDIKATKKMFNNITTYFTPDKVESITKSTVKSNLPIFIVGMPRSGTSLAEQILSSHPDIHGAGELENLHHLVQNIGNELKPHNSYPNSLDNMTTEFADKQTNIYLDAIKSMSPESHRIVDKMPHNFLGLGVISTFFPDATVIHCKRSSIDTCLSIYFQHFNKHHSYSNSLEKLGDYYNLYEDIMVHWKSVLDINIVELQYEDVINNPEKEIRLLLEACNISWHDDCLNFHKNKRTVMTPSYDQVRRPIYKSSVAKWKKYESHIEKLITHLGKRAY